MQDEQGLEVGDTVGGRWRIDRFIASGGFGRVFAATDISSAAAGGVAVKVLLEGASTAERQNFLSEVRHMAALQHPNLVTHIDSGLLQESRQGAVFLVTELCDESLHDFARRQPGGLLPEEQLPALIAHVSAGLDHLHRSGRVHRDLKPANILRSGNQWKLADFGLVRDLSSSGVYHLNSVAGTPRFMAPEFFLGNRIGPASDIWSIGVVVHETMTGVGVHGGEGAGFIHNVTSTPPTISPSLRASVANLIRRCLAADPASRPQAADLHPILAGLGPPEPTEPTAPPVAAAAPVAPTGQVAARQHEPVGVEAGVESGVETGVGPPWPAPTGAVASAPSAGSTAPGGGRTLLLISLLAGLVLVAVVAASVALTGGDDDDGPSSELASEPASPSADASDSTDDDTPDGDTPEDGTSDGTGNSSAGDRLGASVAFDEFVVGDCVDPEVIDGRLLPKVIRDCNAAHSYEVIGLLEHPDTGGAYPGDEVLFEFGSVSCRDAFQSRFGVDEVDTRLQVVAFRPNAEDWAMNLYNVICMANRGDLEPLVVPIGDDAEEWVWRSGDSLNFLELQLERCFDVPNELADVGLTSQRVTFRACDDLHDGEHFLAVLLQDLEGGSDGAYPGEAVLIGEADRRCHDSLHERYGASFPLGSEAVVPSEQEWTLFGAKLAACVVVTGGPFTEPLALMAEN